MTKHVRNYKYKKQRDRRNRRHREEHQEVEREASGEELRERAD